MVELGSATAGVRKVSYLCTLEADFRERNSPGLNLHLTARFSDDVLSFGPIRIRVALSRAYLNFQLQNCGLPLTGSLEQTWPLREKAKIAIKKRSSRQEADSEQLALTASASPSLRLGGTTKVAASSAVETKSENTTTWQHVFWRGSVDNPSLVFDSRPSQKFLSGTLLSGELIGSVEPKRSSFYDIAIELEIPKSGLLLENGDEFASYPNKRGLIKIIAALALCRRPRKDYYREDRFSSENREKLRKLSELGYEQAQKVRIEDLIRPGGIKGGL